MDTNGEQPIYGLSPAQVCMRQAAVRQSVPELLLYAIVAEESKRGLNIPRHYDAEITKAAKTAGIEPNLLRAVVTAESGQNARAVSPKGAMGLSQLMPATAKRYGVVNPFDPAQNLNGGARYLRDLLRQFNGSLELTLAAYNAGEGSVIKAGYRIPNYAETAEYVPKVLALYHGKRQQISYSSVKQAQLNVLKANGVDANSLANNECMNAHVKAWLLKTHFNTTSDWYKAAFTYRTGSATVAGSSRKLGLQFASNVFSAWHAYANRYQQYTHAPSAGVRTFEVTYVK